MELNSAGLTVLSWVESMAVARAATKVEHSAINLVENLVVLTVVSRDVNSDVNVVEKKVVQ